MDAAVPVEARAGLRDVRIRVPRGELRNAEYPEHLSRRRESCSDQVMRNFTTHRDTEVSEIDFLRVSVPRCVGSATASIREHFMNRFAFFAVLAAVRSEERRVGKECRARSAPCQ